MEGWIWCPGIEEAQRFYGTAWDHVVGQRYFCLHTHMHGRAHTQHTHIHIAGQTASPSAQLLGSSPPQSTSFV